MMFLYGFTAVSYSRFLFFAEKQIKYGLCIISEENPLMHLENRIL